MAYFSSFLKSPCIFSHHAFTFRLHSRFLSKVPIVDMTNPKVLVTRSDIPESALKKLQSICDVDIYPEKAPIPRDILLQKIRGKEALFCLLTEKIDKELLDAAGPSLKIVCTMSVGFDHIDIKEIKARGIKVGYTPGVLTEATAELTVALLLATSRRLIEANKEVLNGGWVNTGWSPTWLTGLGLCGSTVGLFGFGRIGQAVARQLSGFNVGRIIYNARTSKADQASIKAEFVDFDTLVSESDFVVVVAEFNDSTKGIFNQDAFAKMKKNAVFVNTSRGGIVDQDSLIEALKTGGIRAAGLDVMTPEPLPLDHPLINIPNLTLLPHIGSAEVGTRETMALVTADNVIAGLQGTPMPHELCL